MESNVNAVPREPWNKGKIAGQKVPSRPRTSGRFEFAFKWKVACASLHCSTWESTASRVDDILLYGLRASSLNPASPAVAGQALQVEPCAIMLRRDDASFKKLVDETLAGLMKRGEFAKLYTKGFQSPTPPKGINLSAPMSQELIDNLKALRDKPAS